MRTFLVRHGAFEYGPKEDGPLIEVGRNQAQQAANWLKAENLGKVAIFSSCTIRADETSKIIAKTLGVDEICYNDVLSPHSDDSAALAHLTNTLLEDLCVGRVQDLDAVVAVSHSPTIKTALSAVNNLPQHHIEYGSIHEYVPGSSHPSTPSPSSMP